VLFIGAVASETATWITTVWAYADIANLLMAFPNLLALWFLSGLVARSLTSYMKDHRAGVFENETPVEREPIEPFDET